MARGGMATWMMPASEPVASNEQAAIGSSRWGLDLARAQAAGIARGASLRAASGAGRGPSSPRGVGDARATTYVHRLAGHEAAPGRRRRRSRAHAISSGTAQAAQRHLAGGVRDHGGRLPHLQHAFRLDRPRATALTGSVLRSIHAPRLWVSAVTPALAAVYVAAMPRARCGRQPDVTLTIARRLADQHAADLREQERRR